MFLSIVSIEGDLSPDSCLRVTCDVLSFVLDEENCFYTNIL